MAIYRVEYLGKDLATDLDAVACGLRVLREDEYLPRLGEDATNSPPGRRTRRASRMAATGSSRK